jgi:hypothetical protein
MAAASRGTYANGVQRAACRTGAPRIENGARRRRFPFVSSAAYLSQHRELGEHFAHAI